MGEQLVAAAHAEGEAAVGGGVGDGRRRQRERVGRFGRQEAAQQGEEQGMGDGRDDADAEEARELAADGPSFDPDRQRAVSGAWEIG